MAQGNQGKTNDPKSARESLRPNSCHGGPSVEEKVNPLDLSEGIGGVALANPTQKPPGEGSVPLPSPERGTA